MESISVSFAENLVGTQLLISEKTISCDKHIWNPAILHFKTQPYTHTETTIFCSGGHLSACKVDRLEINFVPRVVESWQMATQRRSEHWTVATKASDAKFSAAQWHRCLVWNWREMGRHGCLGWYCPKNCRYIWVEV